MGYFGVIITILGLAGVLGTASMVFYSNQTKALRGLLQDENQALKDSNERLIAKVNELQNSNDTLIAKIKVLEELALGKPSINKLAGQIIRQHKQTLAEFSQITTALTDLTNAIIKDSKINGNS